MASPSKRPGQKQTSPAKKQNQSSVSAERSDRKTTVSNMGLLHKLDGWFEPKMNLFFFISIFLSVIFGIYLFDVKISTGGDDSSYIEMAHNFIRGKSFPTWHGPFYCIFLSIPMLIFGVNVVLLKAISFIFIIAQLVLFYYTFRKLVSPTLLALIMLVVSVNSTILYFASQTYSEAMYMFLQSLVIFLFIKYYLISKDEPGITMRKEMVRALVVGLFVFLASLTRNIGIIFLPVMLLVLLLDKRIRASIMLLASYFVYYFPFKLYKYFIWNTEISKGSRPFHEILLKNFYNPSAGYEDFSGMVVRFFENARLYLSKHFMISIGLHDPTTTDKSWFVTIVVATLLLLALYYAIKRNRAMFFMGLSILASMAATFIALQQSWDQMRMVIIYVPMMLLFIAWGLQQQAEKKGYGFIYLLIPALLVLIFFKTLDMTADKAKANKKVLARNIKGNKYYGFTPDWQNYLLMSEWVGKNIPGEVVVAARKPSMSFIYSKGRDFYGMYRFPTETPEALLEELKQRAGELMVLPNKAIQANWPVELQLAIKQSNVAYVAEGSDIFGVYDFKNLTGQGVIQTLIGFQVKPISSDSLLNRLKISSQSTFAVSPDTLINNLRRNKVDYIIVASLRANPNMNTGNIINNIQRYLYFVEQKYPGILQVVHQIGMKPEEEPAWLYKVNYKLYGL
ncbi:MAG: hypothetical protein R6X09_00900 [Bacteroidales bacterium]